jgi:hypothetical protein
MIQTIFLYKKGVIKVIKVTSSNVAIIIKGFSTVKIPKTPINPPSIITIIIPF